MTHMRHRYRRIFASDIYIRYHDILTVSIRIAIQTVFHSDLTNWRAS